MSSRDRSDTHYETARRCLATRRTCTLATASADAEPEAATVRFVSDDELNVYVTTQSTARKYRNLRENPAVAIVVDGDDTNLQLEGVATEVDGDDAAWIRTEYVEKYGESRYLTNDQSVFFAVETDWARLLVDGGYPPTYATVLDAG